MTAHLSRLTGQSVVVVVLNLVVKITGGYCAVIEVSGRPIILTNMRVGGDVGGLSVGPDTAVGPLLGHCCQGVVPCLKQNVR